MSGLNIQEVADEARKMFKFFKVFEKLDEVLKVFATYDQLINERISQAEFLKREIQGLSDKQAILIKGFDDDVYTARINSENAVERYRKEQEKSETAIFATQNHYQEEEIKLAYQHDLLMGSRQTELNNLVSEIERSSRLLNSVQKSVDNLRTKLE